MNKERQAGILLHISSLPSDYGIGTMGKEAYKFVDWLVSAGMKIWQTLPLLPTNYGDSPYQACANNALNYYFIDFDILCEQGLLLESEYASLNWGDDESRVDFGKMFDQKSIVLRKAFSRFDKADREWQGFLNKGDYLDFSVFMAIKGKQNYLSWSEWQDEYKNYTPELFLRLTKEWKEEIDFWQFTQFVFIKQWNALKEYANKKGILIMGDMPIYVASDSVEMWKYRKDLFLLNEDFNPALQAGVPPDAFCDDGQLWGNPVYNWPLMREKGYLWWKKRIEYNLKMFDIVRIDHFRGFDRFFAINMGETTAKNGRWMQGPGAELFKGMEEYNIVAEDLGVIDQGVRDMMAKTGYPGMKVLSFAFDGMEDNDHKPSNSGENCVAYTGTHDNEPFFAFASRLEGYALDNLKADLLKECLLFGVKSNFDDAEGICDTVIRLLFASKAFACIVPMQDVLFLDAESRMNFPSTLSSNNWTYRFKKGDFSAEKATWLKGLVKEYKR